MTSVAASRPVIGRTMLAASRRSVTGPGPTRDVLAGRERRRGQGREVTGGLTIVIGRFLGTVVVTLRGTLGTLAATRLASTLADLIDGQGNLAVALDLRGLEYVAPSGLQVLAAAATRQEWRGGSFLLSEPNHDVVAALDGAHLSRFVGDPRQDDRTMAGARAQHPAGTSVGRRGADR